MELLRWRKLLQLQREIRIWQNHKRLKLPPTVFEEVHGEPIALDKHRGHSDQPIRRLPPSAFDLAERIAYVNVAEVNAHFALVEVGPILKCNHRMLHADVKSCTQLVLLEAVHVFLIR